MSGHDDFAFEAMPGLPERPPLGEDILWQGKPATYALARDAYGLHWIAGYFAVIILWRAATGYGDGGPAMAAAMGLPYLMLAVLGLGVVYGLAWIQARTTVYTLTSARVVMRIGAALPVTFNLPFKQVGAANLDLRRDGTGTIALDTLGSTRISYLIAWPHVRPWRTSKTEPALRSIPDARRVAGLLAEAAEARVAMPQVTRTAPMAAVAAE
ncbi:MAG: photosynthetic complex putative assembly protein PuhB [Tabrizicola sp.]|uniref:photosynthetic complex putative assembly protein PuhB n=1 Tax=Tabrizicola sp. TaxID=2005166 RepID=UPI002734AA10|nr:photosynthetic complex putative assembly protein PuhB [Tabrizicola sp.]MDP3265151.1 photosynthetic complex putative assembly protein PuhB [Tabrizicola sp.]MDP3646919.1 photosynthetic complex putative assembly protein PuhB [Paracoccaceae bacterium]MDZ4069219.1 photosynthetic complex putative assembly protein PuhB [Tabrizicola sp.]